MPFRISTLASFLLWTGLALSSFALPLRTTTSVSCTPASWQDVLAFLIINYASHAATVPAQPGADWKENLPWAVISFLLPFAVWGRSFGLILGYFLYGEGDIGQAIARGAVVIAARSENWEPSIKHTEPIYVKLPENFHAVNASSKLLPAKFRVIPSSSTTTINDHYYTTHGQASLPAGYQWALAPRFNFQLLQLQDPLSIQISRSQSWLKMAISVGQLILSCITIYRARGSQLDQYGYAAFGLSVFPYALMSFVNLFCIGFVGDYPTLYLLRTAILDEAKQCGGRTCGEIGILKEEGEVDNATTNGAMLSGAKVFVAARLCVEVQEEMKTLTVRVGGTSRKFELVDKDCDATYTFCVDSITNQAMNPWTYNEFGRTKRLLIWIWLVLPVLIALVLPYLFIFLLTGFHQRRSTVAERTWMMSWLVASQLAYLFLLVLNAAAPQFSWLSLFKQYKTNRLLIFQFFTIFVFPLLLLFIPAIGGFVTVGRMLFEFGTCSL